MNLALGIGLVSYEKVTVELDVPGIGGAESNVETVGIGTLASSTVSIGYGVSNEVVVGGSVRASRVATNPDGGTETSESVFALGPFLQYVFPGSIARPYMGLGVGLGIASTDDGVNTIDETDIVFGVGAGVSFFLTDSVSLDPNIGFSYFTGSLTIDDGFSSADVSARGISVGAGIGLSAWIGAGSRNEPSQQEYEPAPQFAPQPQYQPAPQPQYQPAPPQFAPQPQYQPAPQPQYQPAPQQPAPQPQYQPAPQQPVPQPQYQPVPQQAPPATQ